MGIAETANQAFGAAMRIVALFKQDGERIGADSDRASSALRLHERFQQNPFANVATLVRETGLSTPTVNTVLADLERLGILTEVTERRRGRIFSYRNYLDILGEGATPLPPS